MATYTKLKSGSWRVELRRKGRYVSETFLRREDARRWATDAERQVDRGETPTPSRVARLNTFGDLIDLHIADMKDVGKAPGRSKDAALQMLKRQLGAQHDGAGPRAAHQVGPQARGARRRPVTVGMDIGAIRLVLSHAAAV